MRLAESGGVESRNAPHLVGEVEPNMGIPSDKRRSARRPGKRERARVKKQTTFGFAVKRSGLWSSAWGAGTVTSYFGRKKWKRQENISRGRNGLPILSVKPVNPNVGPKL